MANTEPEHFLQNMADHPVFGRAVNTAQAWPAAVPPLVAAIQPPACSPYHLRPAVVPPHVPQPETIRVLGTSSIRYLERVGPPAYENHQTLAFPVASMQHYTRGPPRRVQTLGPWSCYKTCHFIDENGDTQVGVLQLLTAPSAQVVISRVQPGRPFLRGLPYRVRVEMATVAACFRAKLNPKGGVTLFQITNMPKAVLPESNLDGCNIMANQQISCSTRFNENPSRLSGSGLSVEPTVNESAKVVDYLQTQAELAHGDSSDSSSESGGEQAPETEAV